MPTKLAPNQLPDPSSATPGPDTAGGSVGSAAPESRGDHQHSQSTIYPTLAHTHTHASTTSQTADQHHAQLHAASHVTGGGDIIAAAIASGAAGLLTGADKAKLDGIATGAQVGTVTSIAQTVPAEFSVSGSPITGAGTLAISKATQSANQVWAGPTSGGATAPTFRALVSADIPALAYVTSVALTVPGVLFSVSGSPITGAGTLAFALLTQTANTILAGPTSGGAATPTMRSLVAADLPAVSLTAGVSGILPSANGGTGINNAGKLTLATDAAITGGGTLALGGFTLTAPATGTAALLATNNLFSVRQDVRASGSAIAAGLHVPWITGDILPALVAGATTSGNTQAGVQGNSDSGIGTQGVSASGVGAQGQATTGTGVLAAVTGAGTPLLARYQGSAVNAAFHLILQNRTTGTAAAGTGVDLAFQCKSTTTNDRLQAEIAATWVDATDATRKGRLQIGAEDTAFREGLRVEASGSAPMIGMLGATAAIRQTGGAATATIAYTATEQTMLQVAYNCLRTFGLLT